jgi:hypothetical protein
MSLKMIRAYIIVVFKTFISRNWTGVEFNMTKFRNNVNISFLEVAVRWIN